MIHIRGEIENVWRWSHDGWFEKELLKFYNKRVVLSREISRAIPGDGRSVTFCEGIYIYKLRVVRKLHTSSETSTSIAYDGDI